MTWVKLDDHFPDHRKVVPLSNSAFRLHIHALCYAADQLTDGFIPHAILRRIGWASDNLSDDVQQLVANGLWEPRPAGYVIHDYCDYNPRREEVLASREARRRAGAAGGRKTQSRRNQPADAPVEATAPAGAKSHADADVPAHAEAHAPAHAPDVQAHAEANASAHPPAKPKQNSTPYPGPYPYPNPGPDPGREGARGGELARSPPSRTHPLIRLYREIMGQSPNPVQAAEIIQTVKDGDLWALCLKHWRLAGYRTNNAEGPLDWYRAGGPPLHPKAVAAEDEHTAGGLLCPVCHARPCLCHKDKQ